MSFVQALLSHRRSLLFPFRVGTLYRQGDAIYVIRRVAPTGLVTVQRLPCTPADTSEVHLDELRAALATHTLTLLHASYLYGRIDPIARRIKISLQMLIGLALAIAVVVKLIHHQTGLPVFFKDDLIYKASVLEIVGLALAYATAIELAYALFTDGPDEAVNPLIVGVAAAILLVVSRIDHIEQLDVGHALGLAVLIGVMAALFALSRHVRDLDKET